MLDLTCYSYKRKANVLIDKPGVAWEETDIPKFGGEESDIKFHLCPDCISPENRELMIERAIQKEIIRLLTSVAVGLEFWADGKYWQVKKKGWFGRWRCETSDGQKYSFLEADIKKRCIRDAQMIGRGIRKPL